MLGLYINNLELGLSNEDTNTKLFKVRKDYEEFQKDLAKL